jgi:hypothetical protein
MGNCQSQIANCKLQTRHAAWFLLLAASVLSSPIAAQDKPDQPDVLKKKVRPADKSSQDKPEPGAKDKDAADKSKSGKDPKEEPDGPDSAKIAKEIFERINKNIRSAEERLKAQDAGDGTQQIQRDVVKDLDSLIEQLKKQQEQQQQQQQQQAGGGGGGGSSKGGGGSSSGGASKQRGSRQGRGQGQGAGQGQGQKGGNQQGNGDQSAKGNGQEKGQQKGQGQGGPGGQGGAGGGMGGNSPINPDKLADLYKDVWGHLPEAMRQEIDAYQKEGYMTKYRELLKLYYATIAEKGRRADERERRTREGDR